MLWDHVAVLKIGGYACNLCETTAVLAEKYALAFVRHFLSQ